MELIQIVIILFALFAFSRVVIRVVKKELCQREFVFWSIIWVVVIAVALIPAITSFFAGLVGIRRGIDLAVYLGIVALFYLVFRLYVKMEKIESDITTVVRHIAAKKKK